jgi:ribosome-associated protein
MHLPIRDQDGWNQPSASTGQGAPLGEGTLELAPGVLVPAGAVTLRFSRSSGPGGQNVNKLSTRAELRVALADLPLKASARARLAALCGSRLTGDGQIVIAAQSERSQQGNRAECFQRLRQLLCRAMVEPKVRRPTRPTRGSVQRRLEAKRARSKVKRARRGDGEA